MKKVSILIAAAALAIGMSGCATMYGAPAFSSSATNQVMYVKNGTIQSVRYVVVQDDSPVGTLLGATTGAALGSTIGKGSGRKLATLAGGLVGAYVGNQMSKANAQELTIRLDNGRKIIIVRKGTSFSPGQRVKIIYNGNQVGNIEAL